MKAPFRGRNLLRTFGMGLTIQTLLSSANFAVGLILIRRTSDLQYSYYILATNTLLLLTALQTSFVQPYIVRNITVLDSAGRFELVGALVRANRRWVPILCGAGLLITAGAWALQRIDVEETLLVLIAVLAGAMVLSREFFRITLFAHRQPAAVLQADVVYVVVLIGGAYLATLTPQPALAAVACVGTAALLGFALLRRELWRFEPWNTRSGGTVLQKIAATGAWAVLGSGIHWLLIQGYSYLVAGVLGVSDIAALAATRLSLMPVFVLSGGVSMLLFPMTTRWVHDMGTKVAARRLMLLAAALGAVALLYMVAMWLLRDWIFDVVLKKHFAHRDALIALWSAVFLVTLCRDQLATLPAARARFREMTLMTGVSALAWLFSSYVAMLKYGPPGAVIGILIGELVNMAGILVMIFKDTRQPGIAATTC
jgi:O-antigen/teichoic acid export membrane protein